MTFKHSIVLGVTALLLISTVLAGVRTGFIGSLSSDAGLSTLRDAEIAVEEINAAGGMGGEKLVLVNADTGENVTGGVEAYEYLAETKKVDFIISGSTGDVSLGWLPRIREFQIPTPDTRTSYIGITDMATEGPETMAPYFMDTASDEAPTTFHINFDADMLKRGMGWGGAAILAEGTTFDEAIIGLVTEALSPVAGIETKEIIVYDVGTVDFVPLFSEVQASGAGFIHQVSSVNPQVISPQYVKLQVPMVMTGVNVSALDLEYWEDINSVDGGISTLSSIPSVGFEPDPESQRFVDTHQVEYDSRPRMPHSNGFNAYQGPKWAAATAEAAGGFGDTKTQFAEMKKQDTMLRKDGKMWLRYVFQGDNEVEEVTSRTRPHSARFNLTTPYDGAQPPMAATQWEEDGEVGVIYPPEYATTRFTASSWVK